MILPYKQLYITLSPSNSLHNLRGLEVEIIPSYKQIYITLGPSNSL